jgi:DNA mismatch repair protein MutL
LGIQLLDQNTINKIAAGEVIERPSSVVKELVENAIDAGAMAITVEIKEGGISFIRVTDNGSGINKNEIDIAFKRHATSKIKSIEDLITVSSLGFRGEALASISAVSQVELITKTKDSITGTRYISEGGQKMSIEDIGAPDGTTFIVRNLFFNTPVRRKFLKSAATEAGYINSLMQYLALSHPDISFRFINNNQNKLHTSGNMKLKDIIYNVYGRDITANLYEVNSSANNIKIEGYIGKPFVNRGNRTYENYYINGRYIKSGIINRAIEAGYKGFIMPHNYPFTVLHFTINPKIIDVNVHPTKMELRFSDNEYVYNFVYDTILSTLKGKELVAKVEADGQVMQHIRKDMLDEGEKDKKPENIPNVNNDGQQNIESAVQSDTVMDIENVKNDSSVQTTVNKIVDAGMSEGQPAGSDNDKVVRNIDNVIGNKAEICPSSSAVTLVPESTYKEQQENHNEVQTTLTPATKTRLPEPFEVKRSEAMVKDDEKKYQADVKAKPEQMSMFKDKLLDEDNKNNYRIIGQLFDTYWLIEFEDRFYMMDQHAAHEKVLYERMMKKIKEHHIDTQMIMPPIILTLNMNEEEVLKRNMPVFMKMGYEIEEFGGNEYKVTGIPAGFPKLDYRQMLMDLIDGLMREGRMSDMDILTEKVASMSCKAAIKGNNKISYEEAKELMNELMKADNPYNCPHGRPTLIVMSKYDIEKKFKRIV